MDCGKIAEPTCSHADLNLEWFSTQDAAARSANRQSAGVAGDGAELSGRLLNHNDSPGRSVERGGAGANSRQGESAGMTIPV